MLTATISGSFHRHMGAISSAVHEFAARGIRVLSPADPRIVAAQGEFLFVASDPVRSVRLVQDRHLQSIGAADFLWLVCPDGYVGQSASMELGFAAAVGVPIFATHAPSDLTLRQYVSVVPALAEAVRKVELISRPKRAGGVLIDPHASVEQAQRILERIGAALAQTTGDCEPARSIGHDIAALHTTMALPTRVH